MSRESTVIGGVRLTDVSVIYTIHSYENGKNVWGWASSAQRTCSPGINFKLILTVKMKTRHPIARPLAVNSRHL